MDHTIGCHRDTDRELIRKVTPKMLRELKKPIETTRIKQTLDTTTKNTLKRKTVIANNDQEANATLGNIINSNTDKTIVYISSLDDLYSSNLLESRLIVSKDDGTSEMQQELGLLLDNKDKPLVLIIDFRKFNPKDIAELNQLFDDPATLQGNKILKDTAIVSITSNELFSEKGGPGPDFARRVRDYDEFIDSANDDPNAKTDFQKLQDEIVIPVTESTVNDSTNKLVVDLTYKDWERELFGYIDITDESALCYQPGKLTQLKTNQELYLKNAPWDDIRFKLKLYDIIKDGVYKENGQNITLPEGIKWHSFVGNKDEVKRLQQKFKWDITGVNKDLLKPEKTAILNSVSFYALIKTASIKNGKSVKHDVLKDWLSHASVLRITDKLSSQQWEILLHRLTEIDRTDIILIQDQAPTVLQPREWQFNNNYAKKYKNLVNNQLKVVFNNMGFIPALPPKNNNALDIQIINNTTSSHLVAEFKNISFKKRTFDIADTDFLTALRNGTPINLYGLEHNMQTAYELESLLGKPPTLCINGNTVIFDKADVTIHLPNDTTAPTRTWRVAMQHAKQKIKNNISKIKKALIAKHKINENFSNNMVDKTRKLVNELNSLPVEKDSPKSSLIADMPFLNKIWIQALEEQAHDKNKTLTEDHFIKAINSVVIKRYRDNSETYHYAKNTVKQIFSSEPNNEIDVIGLKEWMHEQPEITTDLVKKNLWLLSKYIPYDKLTFTKSIFQKLKDSIRKTVDENLKIENFTVKNVLSLLVILSMIPYTLLFHLISIAVIKPVYKLLNFIFILASKILPFINTRDFSEISFFNTEPKKSLKELAILDDSSGLDFIKSTLIHCADEANKNKLQKSLGVSDKQLKNHTSTIKQHNNCEHKTTKLLRDICYSIEFEKLDINTRNTIETIGYHKFCHQLAANITQEKENFFNNINDKENISQRIDNHLKSIFPNEEYDEERLKVVQYILAPQAIESAKQFWDYWDKRRSIRLTAKIKSHPIVMIKGGAGTGKSYAVKTAAEKLAGKVHFFNVRPNTKSEDLLGSFVKVTDEKTGEEKLAFQKGPVTEWAEETGESYKILMLDEFTLNSPVWDCLRTIYEHPPYININGKHMPLTNKHRIVVTSNSDYFPGRHPNEILEQNIPDMHYLQLPQEFQKERIIAPEIDNLLASINFSTDNTIQHHTVKYLTNSIHTLYLQYEKHILDYEFTPRDLHDCCSKVKTYFYNYILNKEKKQITKEMINSVIRRSMAETIANSIPPNDKWKLSAINPWHEANFPGDDIVINEIDQMFDEFYDYMKIKNKQQNAILYKSYDLSNKLTHDLAKTVWLTSLRSLLEVKTGIAHKGKRASLIEGAAGTGKDTIVNMVTQYFQEYFKTNFNYNTITAGSKSFNKVVDRLEDVHTNGGIVTIPELNLLDTKSLEGYFNQLLTEVPLSMRKNDSRLQTFHLWATVNPSNEDYCDRQKLSTALLNRFSLSIIGEHSYNDLVSICKRQLDNKNYAEVIVKFHYILTLRLKKDRIRALPSLEDIKQVSTILNQRTYGYSSYDIYGSSRNTKYIEHIMPELVKQYKIYIKLANWNNNDIGKLLRDIINADTSVDQNKPNAELTNWVNKNFYNVLDSVIVTAGIKTEFIANQGIFTLSVEDIQKSNAEQQELITKHINYYLSPSTQSTPSSQDIDNNDTIKNATQLVVEKKTGLLEYAADTSLRELIKLYAKNMHTSSFRHELYHNQYIKLILTATNNMCNRIDMILRGEEETSLFFANSTERKNIAKKALDELNNSVQLQDQLNILCENNKIETREITDFIKSLVDKDDIINIDNDITKKILNIIGQLDSANFGLLSCIALAQDTTEYALNAFTKIIAKGYINAKDAIKFINNSDNLLFFTIARPYIFDACCKSLTEGKNIDNISKILEYLMEGKADYYDYTIINNLLLLASGKFTPNLAIKAQKTLDAKYGRLFKDNVNLTLQNTKAAEDILKNQPEGLINLLAEIVDEVTNDMIMTSKDTSIEYSYDPVGTLDTNRFITGKAAFEKIKAINSQSQNISVIGVPNTKSEEFANFVYDKANNQLIDLTQLINLTAIYKSMRYDVADIEERLWDKYQIQPTKADHSLLLGVINKQLQIYKLETINKKPFHDYWHVIREIRNQEHQTQITEYSQNPDCNLYPVDEQLINILLFKSLLQKCKTLDFYVNLSHSSEAGHKVIKTLDEVQGLMEHINHLGKYNPLVCPRAIEHKHADIVNRFETEEIRRRTRDPEAAVLHHKDFIEYLQQAVKKRFQN